MASANILSFDINNSPQNAMNDISDLDQVHLDPTIPLITTPQDYIETDKILVQEDLDLIQVEICDSQDDLNANEFGSPNEEPLDPRIKDELETMNRSSDDINNLEAQLIRLKDDLARVMSEGNIKLDDIKLKIGDRVLDNAKPYYTTLIKAKKVHKGLLNSTREFDRATNERQIAKDKLKKVEELFVNSSCKSTGTTENSNIDENSNTRQQTELLENLNSAIKTVNDLDEKVLSRETEHRLKSIEFSNLVANLSICKKKHKRNIIKSKKYFETKYHYEHRLRDLIASRKFLIEQLNQAKVRYSMAMKNLETISLQIHKMRGDIPEIDDKIISNPLFLDGEDSSFEDSSLGIRDIDHSVADQSIYTSTDPGSTQNLNSLDDMLAEQLIRSVSLVETGATKIHAKTSTPKLTYI